MDLSKVQEITVVILPMVFAISVHEAAHGYAAYLLGDKTAKIMGRVTLNPIKHIDLMGTVVVPLLFFFTSNIIYGWAKPVPVNTRNLRNPRRDSALVSLAGPSSNFIMALLWAAIAKLGIILQGMDYSWALPIELMGRFGININLLFGVLNLLPIPPLDGSHILASLLPRPVAAVYENLTNFGWILLLLLVFSGLLWFILGPIVGFSAYLISVIFGL